MKKIVVFTALFGAYDTQLVEVDYDKEKFDFVCFTNQKRLKSKTWDIRFVDDPVPNDNPRSSYYFKTNPHKVWGDQYEISIWVDSSCNRLDTEKLYKMVQKFDSLGTALYIEKHPGRNCIYKELEANIHFKKDDAQAMINHIDSYRKEGMPKEFGMIETGLQIRKHNNPDVIEFQDMLWNEMMTKTRRDQLSWTYCQWKLNFTNFSLFTFQEKIDVLWFQDHPHRSNHIEKVLLVGPWYGDSKYEQKWADYVNEFISVNLFDTIIVGCRPDRESIYKDLQPDKFITANPIGEIKNNLLDNNIPRFNVKSNNKEIHQINPNNEIFNRLKLYDGSIHFKIHIIGWKTEKYIQKCLNSLLNQKHQNWQAQIVLDPDETNETYKIAKKYESDKIKVHLNKERQGPTYNHRSCVEMMNPNDDDVCVTLDADDWFAHDYALTVIENKYLEDVNTLVTHGSWIDFPNPGSLQPNNSKSYTLQEFQNLRQAMFKGSHVRTMKYKIWKSINDEDLKHSQTGKYYDSTGDVAIMIPALEMAGFDRVKFIPDVLYIYNRETNFNEDKVSKTQRDNYMDIINRKPYLLYKEEGVDIIVFSKDRACQLEAFLRSMKLHHKDLDACSVNILYTYSNENYKNGYDMIIKKFPEFTFIKEKDFKSDLINIYSKGNKSYIQFFVDDIIWKNDFSINDYEFHKFESDNDILSLSLRLYQGITYCHPMNKEVVPPKLDNNIWDWKDFDGDWGYPMSLDGNIFRRADIDIYVNSFMYNNPNSFEVVMANTPLSHCKMICYSDSKIVNIPMNRVQNIYQNPCGDIDINLLNEKLLSNEIININKFNDIKNISCHQEFDVEFMKDIKLVIKQPWGGLGDNLQFSTLPEMYYKKYGMKCVYIHNDNVYRNPEIKKLIWDINPYIAGFTSDNDGLIDLGADKSLDMFWTEKIESHYGLKPTNKHPKIYYKYDESKKEQFKDKVYIDVSFDARNSSMTSDVVHNNIKNFISNFKTDKEVYLIKFGDNISYSEFDIKNYLNINNVKEYKVKDIFDYCNLIKYCDTLICTFSGQAVLASAIKGDNKIPKIITFPRDDCIKGRLYIFDNAEYIG